MTFPMPTFCPAPSFSWCYTTGSGTSISVPSCVRANSIIFFSAVRTYSQAYPTYPSGFTQIEGSGGSSPYYNYSTSYKLADGSETTLSTGADEATMIVIVINVKQQFSYVRYVDQQFDSSSPFSTVAHTTTYATSPLSPHYPSPLIVVTSFWNLNGSSLITDITFGATDTHVVNNGNNHFLGFKYISKNPTDLTITSTIPSSHQVQYSAIIQLYR